MWLLPDLLIVDPLGGHLAALAEEDEVVDVVPVLDVVQALVYLAAQPVTYHGCPANAPEQLAVFRELVCYFVELSRVAPLVGSHECEEVISGLGTEPRMRHCEGPKRKTVAGY